MSLRILGAALILIGVACTASVSAQEHRCLDLADSCLCNEPLDNADTTGPGKCGDPSDSDDKECGFLDNQLAFCSNSPTAGAPYGPASGGYPVAFPAGSKDVNVLHQTESAGANASFDMYGGDHDITGKTLCARFYVNYARDHVPPGNTKLGRMGHPSDVAYQSAWLGNGGATAIPLVTVVAFQASSNPVDCNLPVTAGSSSRVTFATCQDSWCRMEYCVEHDETKGETYFRARFTELGGRREHESSGQCPGHGTMSTATIKGGPWARLPEFSTTGGPGGEVYLSHVLYAEKEFDDDFWIGAACEIEGGCLNEVAEDLDPVHAPTGTGGGEGR